MRFPLAHRVAAAISLVALLAAPARAGEDGLAPRPELSLMGGFQNLNQNDTAVPDQLVSIPAVASLSYRLSPTWSFEGEFAWLIPVRQEIAVGDVTMQDVKSPDVLTYQASLRADLPLSNWTPYLAAGIGAATFLATTDSDRQPQLSESQSAFALNFGAGVTRPLAGRLGLRADFRELVAFPSDATVGLSTGGNADAIWMERGTLGLVYRF